MNVNEYRKIKSSRYALVRGHLHKTKLISLTYFRLKYNDNIEEFQLATNMDDVGVFHDIYFKAKVKSLDKPLTVFIQAKHREGHNVLTINSEKELVEYFESYLKIKKSFKRNGNETLLTENTDGNEYLFILYTTAKGDPNNSVKYEGSLAKPLNEILRTGDSGTQAPYKLEDVEILRQIVLKEQIASLAVQMAKCLCDEADCEMSMNNDLMLRFHVILAQKVLDISDIQPDGHRVASFQREFFSDKEELLLMFKTILCIEVFLRKNKDEFEKMIFHGILRAYPTDKAIQVISSYCRYNKKDEKYECIYRTPEQTRNMLKSAKISQSYIEDCIDRTAIKILGHIKFKVPFQFGNKDLSIGGNKAEVERKLNHLKSKIVDMINQSTPNHVIPINDLLGDELLRLSGGLASAVGNLLVSDDKLLKITDDYESLKGLAKKLYDELQKEIHDIHIYRFDVKDNKFPQLSFETNAQDEATAREFLNKLIFYTNQAKEKDLEVILKKEIDDHQSKEKSNIQFKSGAIFLKFHEEIQKWWTTPSVGTYLTKQSDIYENSIKRLNEYKKRSGTAGIRGHLYETKLISLMYFRLKYNDNIEDFQLATNMDDIGAFDDICYKAKVKGLDKPLAVFIQAKHREGHNVLTINSKNELAKYFKSYLKIKKSFKKNDNEIIFTKNTEENEYLFILYTTAKGDSNNSVKYEGSLAKPLNEIIRTGDPGTQPSYKLEDVEILCQIVLKEQIASLAVQMAKFLSDKADCEMSMNNDLMLRFHVILAQKVLDISDIQPDGHRVASFRREFFSNKEELFLMFRTRLCLELLLTKDKDELEKMMIEDSFCCDTSDAKKNIRVLSTYFRYNYKNEKYEYIDDTPEQARKCLDESTDSQSYMHAVECIDRTAIKILSPLAVKVPSAFGNKDLTIRGNQTKVERRLNHLRTKITELINKNKPDVIIPIKDDLEDGLLQLSGGLASAVGNLLVTDDKFLKITDDYESLGDLAKKLYDKLQKEIHNIQVYRFDVKVSKFPQLSFQTSAQDKTEAREFLNRLIFFTNQANEKQVEETLKTEIEDHLSHNKNSFKVKSDAMFPKFHDAIQKWWMSPNVPYLTKQSDIYENSIKYIYDEHLMTVINMIHVMNRKSTDYTFSEDAVNSLQLQKQVTRSVIVTRINKHSLRKVEQFLQDRDYVVLDLEYILNLPAYDFKTLLDEMKSINHEKIIVIVCNDMQNTRNYCKRLETISNTANGKNIIFIINKSYFDIIQNYFAPTDNIINDEKINIIDMSEKSKETILKSQVNFQGEYISLKKIVDNESMAFIEEDILYQIMDGKRTIGKLLYDSRRYFTNIKYALIERQVVPIKIKPMENIDRVVRAYSSKHSLLTRRRKVETKKPFGCGTLYNIKDDVVVLIADPGMGKSTLLTHISMRSKHINSRQCIIRINLLEHAKQFNEWKKNKTVIDTLESLRFLCRDAISEERDKAQDLTITLGESNGDVYLKDCTGDEWTTFELKMFLHFYNRKKLIILFDGFDEICPHYAHEVLKLAKSVKNFPRKHQMWITSRSYDKIMNDYLEQLFGSLYYELKPISKSEQAEFLRLYWLNNIKQTDLSEKQLENINKFIIYISKNHDFKSLFKKYELPIELKRELPIIIVYSSFIDYVVKTFKHLPDNVFNALCKINCHHNTFISMNDELLESPLHVNLVAEYFLNEILSEDRVPHNWELNTNVFYIYERFLETKLKRIRFQEKNKIDLYNPDNIKSYNRERVEFFDTHKKMAAYAVFYNYKENLFKETELTEFEHMIGLLKDGEEKTGIICNVVNDIPVFVHAAFAEYFAIEHISDLVKSNKCIEKQKEIWDFILNVIFFNSNLNVLSTLDTKVELDEKLRAVIEKNGNIVSAILLRQTSDNTQVKVKSSLCEAIRNNLKNLAFIFLSTLANNLVEDNLMDFINIVRNTNMLLIAIKMEYEELLVMLFNIVRRVDESKLSMLFENIEGIEFNVPAGLIDTGELVHKLHTYVWTRMDITPDWENLSELGGQIYFI